MSDSDLLDEVLDRLRRFLELEFPDYDSVSAFANKQGWERIDELSFRELVTPKGKLAFDEFDAWRTLDETWFAASWSSFLLPTADGIGGDMNMNEAWLGINDERRLFEFCCDLIDAEPLSKIDHVEGKRTWLWGHDPEPKGSNLLALKLFCDGEDGAKFSMTRTHRR